MTRRELAGAVLACWCLAGGKGASAEAPGTGFRPEVRVREATRLDWEFAAGVLGPGAAELPGGYESRRQRYQLFVPPSYKTDRPWPLVVFVSPGDDPLGWRYWRKACEEGEALFCAAYGAGTNRPASQRVRAVLDVLDDVRRHYRVDPDRTYLVGFSSAAELACAVAFALPEHFGGVAALGGGGPLPRLAHLRRRAAERLSVAFVAGANDPAREAQADYRFPLFRDLGVRARLWVVPKRGHAVPPPATLGEVLAWLEDDRKRRRADGRAYAGLAASAEEVTPRRLLGARGLEQAEKELRQPGRTFQAVAYLEWVTARCDRTEAGDKAATLLGEVRADPRRRKLLALQAGLEARRLLVAEARARERVGPVRAALEAWGRLARGHPDTAEGVKAAAAVKRLSAALARTPYLGASFEGDTSIVLEVEPGSPALRAGLRAGDRLTQVGPDKVASLADVARLLESHKPGDRLDLSVRRGGKPLTLTVEVGATPAPP